MFSICLKLGIKWCFTNVFFDSLFYHPHIVVSSLHIIGDMYTPSSFGVSAYTSSGVSAYTSFSI